MAPIPCWAVCALLIVVGISMFCLGTFQQEERPVSSALGLLWRWTHMVQFSQLQSGLEGAVSVPVSFSDGTSAGVVSSSIALATMWLQRRRSPSAQSAR